MQAKLHMLPGRVRTDPFQTTMKVIVIEASNLDHARETGDDERASGHFERSCPAEPSDNAVDVHGRQPNGVSQHDLAKRHLAMVVGCDADVPHPEAQFAQKVSDALQAGTSPHADDRRP